MKPSFSSRESEITFSENGYVATIMPADGHVAHYEAMLICET